MTTVNYEADIVAWANEQAWLVRNKKFELLDIEHIAEEIEAASSSFFFAVALLNLSCGFHPHKFLS